MTTFPKIPTQRLLQIIETHPRLAPDLCNLSQVHTIRAFTIPILIDIISTKIPELITRLAADSSPRLRLIVIDALAELFHSNDKTTTQSLVERSKDILEICCYLHALAAQHHIAIVVLNEVADTFDRSVGGTTTHPSIDVTYADQARWFSRAHSVPAEDRKEVSLGLVWANQVNTRILLTRTGRRRYLDQPSGRGAKSHQHKQDYGSAFGQLEDNGDNEAVSVRRLTIIFSSVTSPASLDYIVTEAGISVLVDDREPA